MFVLVDEDRLVMIAATPKRSHMELILEVDFPEISSTMICNANDGGSWTGFSREQMATLYKNTSGLPEAPDYGDCIEQLRAYVLTWPAYHKSEAELTIERQALLDNGDIPPDDPIQQQIAANKAMRAAHQAAIAGCERAHEAHGHAPIAGKAAPAPEKPKAAPRPVAVPTQGITKRVWSISDAVYNANPGVILKEIRKHIMELCHQEGINPGTAGTQFGRWKANKGL